MIRRPPRSTLSSSSAASDVYKRQVLHGVCPECGLDASILTGREVPGMIRDSVARWQVVLVRPDVRVRPHEHDLPAGHAVSDHARHLAAGEDGGVEPAFG